MVVLQWEALVRPRLIHFAYAHHSKIAVNYPAREFGIKRMTKVTNLVKIYVIIVSQICVAQRGPTTLPESGRRTRRYL